MSPREALTAVSIGLLVGLPFIIEIIKELSA